MSGKSRTQLHAFWRTCNLPADAWGPAAGHFDRYWTLIQAHNARPGLMGSVSEEDFHLKHVADSLTLLIAWPELLTGHVSLADVGCGAGLPGIVLAIALPSLRVTAIESNRRKADFVALAAGELGLADRVDVIARRSRALAAEAAFRGRFDVVTARAVADAGKLIRDARRLLTAGGSMILYKTPAAVAKEMPLARREADKHGLRVEASEPIDLPGGAGTRQFLRIAGSP